MRTSTTMEIHMELDDRPGILGEATQSLGENDINILGFSVEARARRGILRLVTDEPAEAVKRLKESGRNPSTREILLASTSHKPGELSRIARTLGESGVNITSTFPVLDPDGSEMQVALDVNDIPSAQKALRG